MKHLFTILLLFPLLLSAQCYGSFEVFAGAGFSSTPSTFTSQSVAFSPVTVGRFGFGASFAVGKRLFLRTGVQLSQYGEELEGELDGFRWSTQTDGSGGFDPSIPSGERGVTLLRTRHNYIEGFLALRYEIRNRGKLRPFVEGGVALGAYGATQIINLNDDSASNERISTIRELSPILRLGAGVNYQLNKRLEFYSMPVWQQQLVSINTAGSTGTRSRQFTLEVGLRVFVEGRN